MDFFSSDQIIKPKRGDLLISEPYLPDPNFERTVIFLCEHDENGSFGFVLNRKAHVKLNEIIDEAGNYNADVFQGGPVQLDTLHFIHREPSLKGNAKEVADQVFWGGDFNQLLSMMNTRAIEAKNIRFFVGYSGWAPDQLMDEMRAKSWIVLKDPTHEMIFDWGNQDLWKACLKAKGGKYKLMSNYPRDPRLN
jgi:putative transcriptional regulator